MARRTVIEVECSRCDRKELVEEKPVGAPFQPAKAAITINMGDGTTIAFDDLCGPCKTAVGTHVAAIAKKIEGVSPERKKKDETVEKTIEEAKKEREAKKKDPPPAGPSFG